MVRFEELSLQSGLHYGDLAIANALGTYTVQCFPQIWLRLRKGSIRVALFCCSGVHEYDSTVEFYRTFCVLLLPRSYL